MVNDPRLGPPFGVGARPPSLVARVLAFAAGAVVLAAALFFSVIVFAVLLVVGVIAGAWLWWQTREVRGVLREQMREAQRAGSSPQAREGEVIEGDYIREARRERDPPAGGSDPGAQGGNESASGDPPRGR
jgi:hypothetical protein